MKVRIGFGLGTVGVDLDSESFAVLVEGLERHGFDSLWLSERIGAEAPDPLIGLAVAAGLSRRLKLGTSVLVLPGRNPALLAKELASLDRLSGGRLLPAFGLGVADRGEQQAFGVAREERGSWFDEALPLVRRCWMEDSVDHDGPRFSFRDLRVLPKPVQSPPEVWLGGMAPSELRRVGRLADGWLPSFCRPVDAVAGRAVVEDAAAEARRPLDPEHFGALVPYVRGDLPRPMMERIAARRPEVDPRELVASGLGALRELLEAFIDRGFSKLVVVPADLPANGSRHRIADELDELAEAVLPLQDGRAAA